MGWQLFSFVLVLSLLFNACDSEGRRRGADGEDEQASDQTSSLKAQQVSGTYLYAISTVLARTLPVVYLAEVEAKEMDGALELRLRQRPLSKLDRATPVGPWTDWSVVLVDPTGALAGEPLSALIPAEANPITGFDTEAEIVMTASLASLRDPEHPDAPLDFLCGEVAGRILSPIPVDDLSGSTFAATRIEDVTDPATYPEVVINCERQPARALP